MMKQFLEPHVRFLVENGYDVEIACSEVLDRLGEVREDLGGLVPIHKLSLLRSPISPTNFKGYLELKKLIAKGNFDLIWTNEPVMGVVTRLAARNARRGGTKVLYMVHGFHFYDGAPLFNWLVYYPVERFMARFADVICTINQEDYRRAKSMNVPNVAYLHGIGVDSERFRIADEFEKEEIRQKLGLSGFILLNVGELIPRKNQEVAILALKKVLKTHPDARLLIAGIGPKKKRLQRLIQKEALQDRVLFLGYSKRLQLFFQACDVVVACSFQEGLPLNIVEATLCGRPVVASNIRGHKEVVKNGVNGYLAEVNDVDDFAKKICSFRSTCGVDGAAIRESVAEYATVNVRRELDAVLKIWEREV